MSFARFFLIASALAIQATAQTGAFTHAVLIDGNGGAPLRDATLWVENGRIREIGPSAKVHPPASVPVTDLTGATVIPGIINLHAHIDANTPVKLRQFALYGVTSVIGMGGDGDDVLAIRDAQRRGDIKGARVYTVQQRFEFEKDAPSVAAARAKVDELARKRVDAVKIVVDTRHNTQKKLSPEIQLAIIDQAHRHHLKVYAHMYELSDAKFLIEHGIDLLAHNVRDTEIDDAFVALMKKSQVPMTATLTGSYSYFGYADSPVWLRDPFFLKYADPKRVAETAEFHSKQATDPVAKQNRSDFDISSRNLRKLAASGARIAFGNDDGNNSQRFEGFFEHLEAEMMVTQAGMTPMQVITSFSKTNSEVLGIAKDYGTLAKGKVADFLILDRSPETDLTATRSLRAVYLGGKKFE
jgi:imidazolonepropionase-like amidohydrolase